MDFGVQWVSTFQTNCHEIQLLLVLELRLGSKALQPTAISGNLQGPILSSLPISFLLVCNVYVTEWTTEILICFLFLLVLLILHPFHKDSMISVLPCLRRNFCFWAKGRVTCKTYSSLSHWEELCWVSWKVGDSLVFAKQQQWGEAPAWEGDEGLRGGHMPEEMLGYCF